MLKPDNTEQNMTNTVLVVCENCDQHVIILKENGVLSEFVCKHWLAEDVVAAHSR